LQTVSDHPARDAEVLLLHVLQVARSHFHAWPERTLTASEQQAYAVCIERFQRGEPVAYIIGHREFWSLDLTVTPATLIPRPETELLVETVLATLAKTAALTVADLGTGSGAIALALATERPHWEVHATDISTAALAVATTNAMRLALTNVTFHAGDWCAALPPVRFDAIISNPPYIALADSAIERRVKASEPHTALFAGADGLSAIRQIIAMAKDHLHPGGYLFLEHGSLQAEAVRCLLEKAGYTKIGLHTDLAGLARVTVGCMH
jgi:release factor glutamine methyltransferase